MLPNATLMFCKQKIFICRRWSKRTTVLGRATQNADNKKAPLGAILLRALTPLIPGKRMIRLYEKYIWALPDHMVHKKYDSFNSKEYFKIEELPKEIETQERRAKKEGVILPPQNLINRTT